MENKQAQEPLAPSTGNGLEDRDNRLIQLQIEQDLLKEAYKKVVQDRYEKEQLLRMKDNSLEILRSSLTTLTKSVSELEKGQSDMTDKDNIITEQNRKIRGLQDSIDKLNIQLSEIYASEGWKLLSIYYRLRNKALPQGSGRHKTLKKIVNSLRGKKNDDIVIRDHTNGGVNSWNQPVVIEPFDFPYFAKPKVSIVIPAYNGWEVNYRCLRSIWENTEDISYEVIFADDVSTDETQNVGKYIGNVVHIRNESNLGFLRNCNQAATSARGEYLHFLNNDTVVTPGWLSSLAGLMDKDPSIGMSGSKLIYPDGRLQEAGGIIWQDASGWNYGHKQDPDASEYNYVKEVDYISGASIMVRKDLWDELGGFHEMYSPAYCEDSDLAFAVRQSGHKVIYQPLSKVVHFEGYSHGTDSGLAAGSAGIKSYQKINNEKFAQKWKEVLTQQFPNGIHPFWTRDRSHHKPTIVVIDHYVPHFDKDAGSRTTFQYLQMFLELGMNVKFIGDNFYKHEPYTTILQQMGIEVFYGTYYAENWMTWLKDNDTYIDYIFLNRPHISIKYIDFLKKNLHGRIFYYTHDLHFFREMMEYEVTKDPEKLASSRQWKKMEYDIFNMADVILTPSKKEVDTISPDFEGKPILVMPAFFYPSVSQAIRNFEQRQDILFVGGFSHKPNVDAIMWFATEIMPLIRENNQDIRLIVVGSNAPAQVTSLAAPDMIIKGYVTDEELDQLYDSTRLAVIPLRYGAGLKGKTVEALSKALPIVSTSFGIEGLENFDGIASPNDTAPAFAAAVSSLYSNVEKLQELSAAASTYSLAHFTKGSATNFFKGLFFDENFMPKNTYTALPHIPLPPAAKEKYDMQQCPCCQSSKVEPLVTVYEYAYYKCLNCDSLFIDTKYLAKIDGGLSLVKYEEGYWEMELHAARERSYGPALARMAEAVYYCKRPIKKFLDIGTGPGYFLDAIAKLLPDHSSVFYGIELFPPDPRFRTTSPNYIIGDLGDLKDKFDCGMCIEVIEHVTPSTLHDILEKLANASNPNALYIFNTGMPEYVLHEDMGYLDPVKRGHLVSYSLKAMSIIGGKHGFIAHRIPGKTWAFALEFTNGAPAQKEDIRDRIWTALAGNISLLSDHTMGDTLKILGRESSKAYN